MGKTFGLYIHIPFCERKCKYCGFLSFDDCGAEDLNAYLKALEAELSMDSRKYQGYTADTVFIGGGTPSLIAAGQISELISIIRDEFDIAEDAEISIEANPNSLTNEKLSAYMDAGINRISIGAQSLDDKVLDTLGRIHDRKCFLSAYNSARDHGFSNINIDLMSGIPGQTMEQWDNTVSEVISLKPEHVSFYSLQLEEGTPFYESYKNGELDMIDTALDTEMYHEAVRAFKDSGYEHYEISNAALPGHECRHNLKYWSLGEYLGAGLGASSYMNCVRYKNEDDIKHYCKAVNGGEIPVDKKSLHNDTEKDSMGIYCFTALRTSAGIDTRRFSELFGKPFFAAYSDKMEAIGKYMAEGSLKTDGGHIMLTENGIDVSNDIMSEFV